MDLNQLSELIHARAIDKGFYGRPFNVGEKLMLITSELAEALEAHRCDKHTKVNIRGVLGWTGDRDFERAFKERVKDTFEDELADSMIRLLDLAAACKMDIEAHVATKMRYNDMRLKLHGKAY